MSALRRGARAPWALLAVLSGCARDPTELVLIVDSDLQVPSELDAVGVLVVAAGGARTETEGALVGNGALTLPLSLGITAASESTGPVTLTVTGRSNGRAVVVREARVAFVPHTRRSFRVVLQRACAAVVCAAGQTCEDGRCRALAVAPEELGPFTGIPARVDASTPGDAAGEDTAAPSDTNPPPDTEARTDTVAPLDTAPQDVPLDTTVEQDTRPPSDTTPPVDTVVAMDTRPPLDTAPPMDTAPSPDTRPESDTGRDAVDATDGGTACPCAAGLMCCGTVCAALAMDPTHCGRCGVRCTAPPMAVATCALGVCGFACVAPFANCDGNPVNGCETNTALSVLHCGRCGSACAPANAVGRCEAGRCSIAGCNMPFSDCDMSVANGCEVNLRTPENCGECGRRCMPPMTMVATCERGLCASICAPGMADCDMNAANGCETSTHTVDNCVTCGNVCEVHPRATPRCGSTGCQNTCLGLFGDCDGNVTNGCERDVSSDASNCGACGFECGLPRANAMCVRGVCAVERCELDFGNCDGVATNGCEVDLTSDNNHCGRCNNRCAAGTSCSGSRCM